MKSRILFLLRIFLLFLLYFVVQKAIFMLYNGNAANTSFSIVDLLNVITHGLGMDASSSGYLLILPFLLVWIGLIYPRMPVRKILLPYYVVIAILTSVISVTDISLYEFWGFKLDATVFFYLESPKLALASVSIGYIIARIIAILVLACLTIFLYTAVTPTSFSTINGKKYQLKSHLSLLLCGGLIFLMIRGGIGKSTMNSGNAYFSDIQFFNHSAVNPAFNLLYSWQKSEDFSKKYNYLKEDERQELFSKLYPKQTQKNNIQLLRTQSPNVLIILLEGYGGTFIEALGGLPEVSPNFNRLIKEGIFFNHFYANSFRTDRGVVCALSGHISYPTNSIMKLPSKSQQLPSIAKTLLKSGYSTEFIHGGDVNFTNMQSYLRNMGYKTVIGDTDFSIKERSTSAWGVCDEIAFNRLYDSIKNKPADQSWHTTFLTLSSHEPFDVPYNRLKNKQLNAFAYTDHCLGIFINKLKKLSAWDNLLVICLPDHGFRYKIKHTDPKFFHVPMLWLGGAIRSPQVITKLMNQSDMAATLLAQMNLPHNDFKYSRDIFSPQYTYPFAYSTFGNGFLFIDSTGTTVFDNEGKQPIVNTPQDNRLREKRGKSILQSSYDELGKM